MNEPPVNSLNNDRFIKHVGIIMEKVEPGYALVISFINGAWCFFIH